MADWFNGVRPGELVRRLRAQRSNSTLQDLEDAVQDVYLHALETARRTDPPATPHNPEAYLARSVHNRLNSMQRARRREVGAPSPEQIDMRPDALAGDAPHEIHEARERAQAFAALVGTIAQGPDTDTRALPAFAELQRRLADELNERHWLLLRLRILQGVGVVPCSRLLGISVGSVHNWTRRALAIVRACLREAGIEPGDLEYDHDGP